MAVVQRASFAAATAGEAFCAATEASQIRAGYCDDVPRVAGANAVADRMQAVGEGDGYEREARQLPEARVGHPARS